MKNFLLRSLLCLCSAFALAPAMAQPTAIPPNILASNNLPMVMLTASKDFTMFWKAYTDFDDIDFDGVIDRTYKPAFKYYGYFDSAKCYSYSTANTRYEPKRFADIDASGNMYCTAGASEWSGNFLNWVSMSRIDVLRKVLYGGLRSVDTATATTLELSFVPRNSQAFVKYYNGADLNKLTPFNSINAMKKGVTFCRRPLENVGVSHVNSLLAPLTPEIRAAVGNLILWNMTETRTCNWSTELGYTWQGPTITYLDNNYLTPAGTLGKDNSDHRHLSTTPDKTGENTGFVGRVQACVTDLLGGEKCQNYGTAASPKYKPIGLLQEFGTSTNSGVSPARSEFGLMMGSYDNNLQGGVLRKNMGQLNDEVDSATGVFLTPASGGIIRSFNEITLYGYDLATGNYIDSCFSDTIANGSCSSWGNPVGELVLESLRFYAGKSPAYAAGLKDTAVGLPSVSAWIDPLKSNPTIGASTRTQLYGQPICRPLNMLTVTSGSSSFDDNALDSFTDLGATATAAAITNLIGDKEGITGTVRLIGETTADGNKLCTGKTIDGLGNVKGICADGPNFRGTYLGAGMAYYANTNQIRSDFTNKPTDLPTNALKVRSYGVSMSGGVATIEIPTKDGKKVFLTPASLDSLLGHVLPGNLVDFKILNRAADGKSGAALVLWQHNLLGEDQDQDMLGVLRYQVDDTATPWQLKVYTQAVESNTGSTAQYAFGYTLVGTTNIDNSASDGVHLHSGINKAASIEGAGTVQLTTGPSQQGINAADNSVCVASTGSNGTLCSVVDGKTTRGETYKTYKLVGGTDALMREPLWYMSKYGGFKADAKNTFPTSANPQVWDVKRADGKPCGGTSGRTCNDGEPDNYFVARSPALLESSLREVLEDIVNSSNTAPAVSASQLRAGDLKYVAKFDSGDGRGELSAFAIDSVTGAFQTLPTWNAHEKLTQVASISRPVLTNVGGTGVAFQWGTIGSADQNVLKSGITDPVKATEFGQAMMAWLRGDTSDTSRFRLRAANSVLGSIVNSNPTVQTPPAANFSGSLFSGYGAFATTWADRNSIVWVGAGDGMLHGFDASSGPNGGTPIMSYIPEPVFAQLPNWASATQPKVQAFVDGSPMVADVKVGSTWSTYLFGALGRGGKGIFALDVTRAGTSGTSPSAHQLTESNAATVFKWQFTNADDADLGYVIAEPTVSRVSGQPGQIARMNNGKFGVLVGNGVASASGKAVLYILFADGPSGTDWTGRYIKLVADTGTGNGLSAPTWVDTNDDGIADYIYAGDLKGNVWKFDVSDANSANWKTAYFGMPLFIAKDSANNLLPITSAPEYRFHPLGGVVIDIATGKSIDSGDFPNTTRTHSIFGIWDKPAFATASAAMLSTTLPRSLSSLQQRTFVDVAGSSSRSISGTAAIDWTTKSGWYLPFDVSSEMSVSDPTIANGQLVIVSVSPAAAVGAGQAAPCFATPLSRLTAIDPITGLPSGLLGTTTIINAGGGTSTVYLATIGIDDQKVRISKDVVGKGASKTSGDCANGRLNCTRVTGGGTTDLGLSSKDGLGRIFWREIPGLKTRKVN